MILNESGFRPPLCTNRLGARVGQENLLRMVRWMRWHYPPDTGFEIRALAVWGRARYLSVTEAPHNTDFYTWMGEKHVCFFQTAETGNRTPNSSVKGSGANHYPRAPAPHLTNTGSTSIASSDPMTQPDVKRSPGCVYRIMGMFSCTNVTVWWRMDTSMLQK